jgi:signal transduction histidine kinase
LFRIQTVSAAFSSVTGIGLPQVNENGQFKLVGDSHNKTGNPWQRAAMSREIETLVQQINDESKSARFLEYIAIPMKEESGINAVVVIISDITKRKNFEQQLVHTEKLVAAGEMSSIIAHEFRNALTSVKMILQLFSESEKVTRTEKKSLAVALDSIYHMESIVTELLNFARPKPVQRAMTDLNKIVQECLEFVGPHLQQHNIKITTSLDRTIKQQSLDGSRMKEAIINLLLNSIQAQDEPGTKTRKGYIEVSTKQVRLEDTIRDTGYGERVSLSNESDGSSEIILEKKSECTLIEIHDNGKGIGKDELCRIFDPFYTTKTNGTGLGLPMVKRTVIAHGGVVTVESTPGEGTLFKIYIPTAHVE